MKISIAILAAAAIVEASPQRKRTQNIHNSAVVNAEEEYDVYLGLSNEKNSVFGRELQDEEDETGESEMPTYSPTKGDSATPTYSPTCEGDCAPAPVPAEEETTTTEPPVAAPADEETTTTTEPPVAPIPTEPPVATTEEETTTTEPPVAPIPDIEEEDVVVVEETEMSMPTEDVVVDEGLIIGGATEADNTASTLYGSSIVVVAAGIATTWLM